MNTRQRNGDCPKYLNHREWAEMQRTPELAALARLAFHEHHVPGLAPFLNSFSDVQEEYGDIHDFPFNAHVIYDAERVEWIIVCLACGLTAVVTPGSVLIDGKFGPADDEGECECEAWDEVGGADILTGEMFLGALGSKRFPRIIWTEEERAIVWSFLGIGAE